MESHSHMGVSGLHLLRDRARCAPPAETSAKTAKIVSHGRGSIFEAMPTRHVNSVQSCAQGQTSGRVSFLVSIISHTFPIPCPHPYISFLCSCLYPSCVSLPRFPVPGLSFHSPFVSLHCLPFPVFPASFVHVLCVSFFFM